MKILVVGSLNMDTMLHVTNMPKKGETIFGNDLLKLPGGKGANQAYAAAKLGASVSMIGAVGSDQDGETLLKNLKGVNIDTSGIEVLNNTITGSALVTIDELGNNHIVVIPGANFNVNIDIIKNHSLLIEEADIVILQLEIPMDTVSYVIKYAKSLGKIVILDPAPSNDDFDEELLQYVDIVKPNETELTSITGVKLHTDNDIIAAAKSLIDKGVSNVIVTLGDKGNILVSKDLVKIIDSRKVDAIDSTGAGDCFIGALATKLAEGKTIEESVTFANIAASIAVTKRGAQSSMPSLSEVNEVLNNIL